MFIFLLKIHAKFIIKDLKFLKKLNEEKLKYLYFEKENNKNFNKFFLIDFCEKEISYYNFHLKFYRELRLGKFFCWHSYIFLHENFTIGEKFQCQKCKKIKYY